MRLVAGFCLSALAVAGACSGGDSARSSIANVSAEVARAAALASGQDAPMADAVEGRSHLGFDTGTYPGDAAMLAWRSGGAPYEWAGYYMKSPCHQDEGWMGKREALTKIGYGLAVLYVGQQTWGRKPGAPHFVSVQIPTKQRVRVGRGRNRKTVTRTIMRTVRRLAPPPAADATCNADFVTAKRGNADGFDAANRAESEGFPHGTTVFLDLERMDMLHPEMRAYYSAWVRAMLLDGRYTPGIYVHTYNANTVYSDVKGEYVRAGVRSEPPFWIAKSQGFTASALPHEMGHAFAAIWQGVLDVTQTWNGHRIPIDVNVAATRSPSSVVPMERVAPTMGN